MTAATSMPALSTRMWPLMPSTFVAPSKLRGPDTADGLTDEESTTAAEGFGRRAVRVRTSPRTAVSTLAQVWVRHQRQAVAVAVRGHMTDDADRVA
jgi:hypothetical protein